MPAKSPPVTSETASQLRDLGLRIRLQRKKLNVSATVAAESAAMSRVTWHRIERGEPSVTIGAWLGAMATLGLHFDMVDPNEISHDSGDWIPARIHLADYPQLKQLAWHIQGDDKLTPREALDIYERNIRHLDLAAMTPAEQRLLAALRTGLGENGNAL